MGLRDKPKVILIDSEAISEGVFAQFEIFRLSHISVYRNLFHMGIARPGKINNMNVFVSKRFSNPPSSGRLIR